MNGKRSDAAYEIGALSKGLLVLEALEGTSFEPVTLNRIVERSRLPKDTVYRSLRTLRLMGWATNDSRGNWMIGQRFIRLVRAVSEARTQ